MRLTKEREEMIRYAQAHLSKNTLFDELLDEIDALRKDYKELTEVIEEFICKQEKINSGVKNENIQNT